MALGSSSSSNPCLAYAFTIIAAFMFRVSNSPISASNSEEGARASGDEESNDHQERVPSETIDVLVWEGGWDGILPTVVDPNSATETYELTRSDISTRQDKFSPWRVTLEDPWPEYSLEFVSFEDVTHIFNLYPDADNWVQLWPKIEQVHIRSLANLSD